MGRSRARLGTGARTATAPTNAPLSPSRGTSVIVFAVYNAVELIRQNRMDSQFAPRCRVDLGTLRGSDGGRSPETAKEPSLRVAIAPVVSPEKSLQLYQGLVNHLAEKLGRRPVSLPRGTYVDVNDLLRYGRCDLAFVCTYPFVRGEREFGLEILVVPEIGGEVTYHSLILVPRGSNATSLLDLRGKRFASADILSNSGWLYPATWLKDRGEDATSFFGEHVITGSHDRSVTAVNSAYTWTEPPWSVSFTIRWWKRTQRSAKGPRSSSNHLRLGCRRLWFPRRSTQS